MIFIFYFLLVFIVARGGRVAAISEIYIVGMRVRVGIILLSFFFMKISHSG